MALVPFKRAAEPAPYDEPDDPDDLAADDEEAGGKMSFLEHLDELRRRLVVSIVSVLVGFLLSAVFFIDQIFAFVMKPLQAILPHGGKLIYTEPTEAFMLQLKVAALAGLILAAPVVMWQVWLFVAPGLYAREKRFALPFVVFSSLFFIGGAAFSHYVVFPTAWAFLASFTTEYMEFTPKISSTFSLYARMLLAFGLVFQMPTVIFALARMGVVTAGFLARNIKYAVLIIFVVAAVVTPTSDVVTQAMMAAPMIVLYGLSIVIAWVFGKKKPRNL